MRDDETILVLGSNIFFVPRIGNAARPHGYSVKLASTAQSFHEAYDAGGVALVLVDLEGEKALWSEVLRGLPPRGSEGPRVVAFGPHSDVESLELATSLGCDAALTKGAFSGSLGRIVESRGDYAAQIGKG